MDKKKLLKYLQSLDLFVIATHGKSPNAVPVFYGIDDNFIIYIVTPPSTEHGRNIAKDSDIACVVVDTNQRMYKTITKIGVQIKGHAKELKNPDEMKDALMVWSKGKSEVVKSYLEKISTGDCMSRPYKIIPTEIKWFNEKLYGKEGTKTFTW